MKPIVPILFVVAVLLQGCSGFSESGANPANWFSSTPSTTLEPEDGYEREFVDTRALIADITELHVEQTLGGVIVRAVGLPPTQGYWDASLVPVNATDTSSSRLVFDFRVRPPLSPGAVGTARSREVEVGTFLSNDQLEGVRQVVVTAARNSRTSNR